MKILLVFLCSTVTLVTPGSLDGYQYKQNSGGFIGNSLLGNSGGGHGGGGHSGGGSSHQGGFIGSPLPQPSSPGLIPPLPPLTQQLPVQTSYGAPHVSGVQGQVLQGSSSSFGVGGGGGGGIGGGFGPGPVQSLAPVITKDVYVHVAPDEHEEHAVPQHIPQQPPRKHYRIIFIKAPSESNRASALKLAQAQAQIEEKTVIYVLSKKTDAADIQAALQQAPQPVQHKPEVFFIKYKTQQEALHAQQQIQAQYDALGGTSSISDEGIAPVSSVIGALGSQGGGSGIGIGGHSHGQSHGGGGGGIISGQTGPGGLTSQTGYLPPHRH